MVATELSMPICVMSFTGSQFLSASPTELLNLSGCAFLAVLHPTCLIYVYLSLSSQPVELCVLHQGGAFDAAGSHFHSTASSLLDCGSRSLHLESCLD